MSAKVIIAITEHFDPDNVTAFSRAINATQSMKLHAFQTNNMDIDWPEILAVIYPAEGDGFTINAMCVPLACIREVGEVLQKYADDINRLTAQVQQHTNGVAQ